MKRISSIFTFGTFLVLLCLVLYAKTNISIYLLNKSLIIFLILSLLFSLLIFLSNLTKSKIIKNSSLFLYSIGSIFLALACSSILPINLFLKMGGLFIIYSYILMIAFIFDGYKKYLILILLLFPLLNTFDF